MKSIEDMMKAAYDLCDYGILNDVIRGYLIAAMQDAGFSRDEVRKALLNLAHEFDQLDSNDAEKIYKEF